MMKIGHRGAPGNPRFAENTFSSFQKALTLGADAIEFDVRRAGEDSVVFHDQTLERMTQGGWHTPVKDLSHNALNSICTRYVQETGIAYIPRLWDVLMTFGNRCFLHIELKERGLVEEVKNMIIKLRLQKSVCISAFDFGDEDGGDIAESSWKELCYFGPEIRFAFIASQKKVASLGLRAYILTAQSIGASTIHTRSSAVTDTLILYAHDAGLRVNVFVANEPTEILRLKRLGVDGIISDFPELL